MVRQELTAEVACRAVGYTSPSQFSREFRRLFGSDVGGREQADARELCSSPLCSPTPSTFRRTETFDRQSSGASRRGSHRARSTHPQASREPSSRRSLPSRQLALHLHPLAAAPPENGLMCTWHVPHEQLPPHNAINSSKPLSRMTSINDMPDSAQRRAVRRDPV